jgi:hypothetical protein
VIFLKQLNLFEITPEYTNVKFELMDKVKVQLVDEEIDSETHNYRKYYEAHILNKVGEVTQIIISERNIVTYEVEIYGAKYYLLEYELKWIG